MGSSPEISDDDESFEVPSRSVNKLNPNQDVVNLISDEDSDNTIEYMDESFSGSENELPSVNLQATNVARDNVIKKLFPKPGGAIKKFDELSKFSFVNKPIMPSGSKPQNPMFVEMIGGVQVHFPVPPYGSQKALMFKVITGINKKQNCLLESPTGSGKTLALLCGALAWQRHERNRIADLQSQSLTSQHPELNEVKGAKEAVASPVKKPISPEQLFASKRWGELSIYDNPERSGSGDAKNATKRLEPDKDCSLESPDNGLVKIHKKRKGNEWEIADNFKAESLEEAPRTPEKQNTSVPETPATPQNVRNLYNLVDNLRLRTSMIVDCSVPTIYYGARTHKQIQQVVKEFRRTTYCGEAKMTVLSSREYSCIRAFDQTLYKNRNDMCRECVTKAKVPKLNQSMTKQSTNCEYYENRKALSFDALPPAFDLEDLVSAGHELKACPYYAARMMTAGAQIIFCPYNYLIDPTIRSSMQIELRDEIVILDEAHNIEDICRDSASFTFTQEQVQAAIKELEVVTSYEYANQAVMNELKLLVKYLTSFNHWFGNQLPLIMNKPVTNNEAVYTWEVQHFATTLDNHNIGAKQYLDFRYCAEVLNNKLQQEPEKLYGVTQSTGSLVDAITLVLSYLFRHDGKFMDDFKPALVRSVAGASENLPDARGWRSSQFNKWVDKDTLTLRMMCMNPSVVFSGLQQARCIILSSGTLTPLVSLHSELDTKFPLQVSPNHVIPADRVWIGTLTTCPNGKPLECKSSGTNTVEIQDAIGEAVLWVSKVTPNGVLCFVPSYVLMNKLTNRWRETGLWRKLNNVKNIFIESRNVRDHGEVMDDFYKEVITDKGALLFAVYRGKVSEGMDFKDHQARAVITVGIPYPNMFEMMVKEKMNYNDRHASARHLLPSSEWLRVQAYRALNQAVGRCVRHKNDWGAVLLIDSRFALPYYTEHLSKWVRNFLGNNHNTFETLVNNDKGLETFMQSMSIRERDDGML